MEIKNDDRGFSLVELIVVVLIMAIIAIALAPQVMKWAENSRISSDIQTRNSLKEQCEIAMTSSAAFNKVKDGDYMIIVTKDTAGNLSFVYNDATGHDITPDPTDDYWANMLALSGDTNFTEFQNKIEIKSTPSGGPITLKVKIYEDGHTKASLEGIPDNEDIEVISETIEDDP